VDTPYIVVAGSYCPKALPGRMSPTCDAFEKQ
jgi:hypothetical protein